MLRAVVCPYALFLIFGVVSYRVLGLFPPGRTADREPRGGG
jgi:hypothetical protein